MKKIFYITFLSLCCSTLSHAQCTTQAGTLPSDTLFICQNDITSFQHQDAILTEQDALIYVLKFLFWSP